MPLRYNTACRLYGVREPETECQILLSARCIRIRVFGVSRPPGGSGGGAPYLGHRHRLLPEPPHVRSRHPRSQEVSDVMRHSYAFASRYYGSRSPLPAVGSHRIWRRRIRAPRNCPFVMLEAPSRRAGHARYAHASHRAPSSRTPCRVGTAHGTHGSAIQPAAASTRQSARRSGFRTNR